jgi:GMP synthase (glutamine-hydrolysing)
VQFHPEFDADIVRAYLAARRPVLEGEGFDVDRMLADVVEAPHASAVLRRFAGLLDD